MSPGSLYNRLWKTGKKKKTKQNPGQHSKKQICNRCFSATRIFLKLLSVSLAQTHKLLIKSKTEKEKKKDKSKCVFIPLLHEREQIKKERKGYKQSGKPKV